MSNPDITVPPRQIHWFYPFIPKEIVGPCPHYDCDHRHRTVVAWGPTDELYEFVECGQTSVGDESLEMVDGCGCRAWRRWLPRFSKANSLLIFFETVEDDLRRP